MTGPPLVVLDACVLAKFGSVRELRCLAIPKGPLGELQQLVERRRQLIDIRTAESNPLQQTLSKSTTKSIQAVLNTLEIQVESVEKQIDKLIGDNDDWK